MARLDFSRDFFTKMHEVTQVPTNSIYWTAVPEKDKQRFPSIVMSDVSASRDIGLGGGHLITNRRLDIHVYANHPVRGQRQVVDIMDRLSVLDGFAGELVQDGTRVLSIRQDFATVSHEADWVRGIVSYRVVLPG